MSGEDVNPVLEEAYESLNDVLERKREIDPSLANELENIQGSLDNVRDKVDKIEERNEEYEDALETLSKDFEDTVQTDIDDREQFIDDLRDIRKDLDDIADDETDTKDAAAELDDQRRRGYDEDEDEEYTIPTRDNDGTQQTNRRGYILGLLAAGGLGACIGLGYSEKDGEAVPPTDDGSDGTPPTQDGGDGTDQPNEPDPDPEPSDPDGTDQPDDQDPTPDEQSPNYDDKDFWVSELESKSPAQYSDFVENDNTIIEICRRYKESRFEDVALIGSALSKDSNDIILDEEGQNLGEDLALAWWDRDDIIDDTDYEDLDEDIEGIVALKDWQKNVYEFGILDEEQYDFAVDVAEEVNNNYSLQNSADPMEYLAGGSI